MHSGLPVEKVTIKPTGGRKSQNRFPSIHFEPKQSKAPNPVANNTRKTTPIPVGAGLPAKAPAQPPQNPEQKPNPLQERTCSRKTQGNQRLLLNDHRHTANNLRGIFPRPHATHGSGGKSLTKLTTENIRIPIRRARPHHQRISAGPQRVISQGHALPELDPRLLVEVVGHDAIE